MDNKTALKKAYLQNPPPAGIYQITNKVNGKIFIGKGLNAKVNSTVIGPTEMGLPHECRLAAGLEHLRCRCFYF